MAAQLDASDAALDGFVPSLDHASFADWDAVYEPAEDTFLLLDALFAERSSLRALGDATVVEVGPGSGVVSAYVAALLAAQAPRVVCVDVNPRACALSRGPRRRTARASTSSAATSRRAYRGVPRRRGRRQACPQVPRSGSVGALVFNPPYVPTPRAEVGGAGIEASWAGGDRERPDDIARILAADGAERTTVATKRVRGPAPEAPARQGRPRRQRSLSILRFARPGS
ncbi:protein methyltransferase [Aureococcus anophagefferens]|nr:protein methyltransferase [Aureococcus anophagefferens]